MPEVATDVVTWSYEPMDPWHLAYTPGIRPLRVEVDGEVVLDEHGPTRVDAAEVRAQGARSGSADCSAADGGPLMASRVAPLPPGRAPDPRRHALRAGRRGSAGSRRCGRPRAGWCARPPSRSPRSAVTERIKLGSGVVSMWVRNPAFLAATFSTLDDLAPGRAILGIGAWWDPLAAAVGVSRDKPLRAMREIVTTVRALLANETVTFDGEFVHLDGVELDYVHQGGARRTCRSCIGATGMQMMELAGEIADGALLNYLVSPAYNTRALAALDEGAAKAGRSLDDIDRPQLVVCSMDDDRDAALDAARLLVTQYLGQQPHIMKASGVPESLLDDIGKVLTWPATHEQVVAASKLVPDEVVQLITASGTPDECRAKVHEYIDAGCTCPVLYPLGDGVSAMIDKSSQPRAD